ncbi:hypothetical protein L6452_10230 [Arctium lappa]|uniref:Uncharacterized protein n=1 Tax=Arctium lappa TaxID=4217 RepID=A0ACB9DME8_ARCLA|nr:hypothetical protein L6452_10230 [Arctium lappa]
MFLVKREKAIQCLGGNGYVNEYPTGRFLRDAKLYEIGAGRPELKRLKLQRNNWDSSTFEFDEVHTEFASHKQVYEAVAKPIV